MNELFLFDRTCKSAYLEWNGKLRQRSIVGDHELYFVDDGGYPMCHHCAQVCIDSPTHKPVAFGINFCDYMLECTDCRQPLDAIDQIDYEGWIDEQAESVANERLFFTENFTKSLQKS